MKRYNSRVFLNNEESIGDSTMRCFDGGYIDENGKFEDITYITISDCYSKIKIHPIVGESKENFINKVELIKYELDKFLTYLKTNNK